MKVRFLDVAEIELDDAIKWHEAQVPGLGDAFLIEILSALDRVLLHPRAWLLSAKESADVVSPASHTA